MARNYLLDGLRGMAALGVACYHAGVVIKPEYFPGGYLAVDFFFVLSGFVVDRAYRGRIEHGLTVRQFMVVRLYRLYPLFALGLLFGLVRLLIKLHRHDGLSVDAVAVATVLNALMLPVMSGFENNFPLDSPAWSLFCEMVMNLVFAAGLVRARGPLLWTAVAIGAAGMVVGVATVGAGLDLGWRGDTLVFGLARALFGFTLGMILARFVATRAADTGAVPVVVPIALLAVALLAPVPAAWRSLFDLGFAFVAAPLIVVFGARALVVPRLNPLFYGLGIVSYPLYALHLPIFQLLHGALGGHLPQAVLGGVAVAVAVGVATVAERLIDLPARRRGSAYLSRVSAERHQAPLGG